MKKKIHCFRILFHKILKNDLCILFDSPPFSRKQVIHTCTIQYIYLQESRYTSIDLTNSNTSNTVLSVGYWTEERKKKCLPITLHYILLIQFKFPKNCPKYWNITLKQQYELNHQIYYFGQHHILDVWLMEKFHLLKNVWNIPCLKLGMG